MSTPPSHAARGAAPRSSLALMQGVLIGVANIIPGVSGGTFALILGIFDRLVGALNALDLHALADLTSVALRPRSPEARRRAASAWRRVDGSFLLLLAAGAVLAILGGSFLIDYLLRRHYSPTLALFIGLIVPSVQVPWAMMQRRGARLLWLLPGVALTVGVSLASPTQAAAPDNPLVAFLAGALAISAMILPGISGSYVLLVLGQYQNLLTKLTGFQLALAEGRIDGVALAWLSGLGLGLVVGIVLFARLLHLLLDRWRDATLAFLIGLLFGSLWVLWPFKQIDAGAAVLGRGGEVKQEIRIATAPNRLPGSLGEAGLAAAAFAAGLLGSAGLIAVGRRGRSDAAGERTGTGPPEAP